MSTYQVGSVPWAARAATAVKQRRCPIDRTTGLQSGFNPLVQWATGYVGWGLVICLLSMTDKSFTELTLSTRRHDDLRARRFE